MIERETDGEGYVVSYGYDGARRKTAKTAADGTADESSWHWVYDRAGNLTAEVNDRVTGGPALQHFYDELNRRIGTMNAEGNLTAQAFDEAGNVVCARSGRAEQVFPDGPPDPMTVENVQEEMCEGEFVTQYTYDELGKLTKVTDAEGGETTFVYDKARRMVAKQDARASLTTYEYDARAARSRAPPAPDAILRSAGERGPVAPADRAEAAGCLSASEAEAGRTLARPSTGSGGLRCCEGCSSPKCLRARAARPGACSR